MMVINMLLSGLRRSQATMSDCLARVGNSLPTAVPWRRLVWCSTVPFAMIAYPASPGQRKLKVARMTVCTTS